MLILLFFLISSILPLVSDELLSLLSEVLLSLLTEVLLSLILDNDFSLEVFCKEGDVWLLDFSSLEDVALLSLLKLTEMPDLLTETFTETLSLANAMFWRKHIEKAYIINVKVYLILAQQKLYQINIF